MDRYQNIKPVSKLIGFDFVNDYCIEKELALFNQLSIFYTVMSTLFRLRKSILLNKK
jgi:hypothetical protein